MNTLIVYYSRTGTTAKVAEVLKEKLGADIAEIKCDKYPLGAKGYMQAGKDATLKSITKIKMTDKDLTNYDLVFIGTPVWSWNVSPPVRTFCRRQKDKIKKAAFFCTMGGSGHKKAFKSMADEIGIAPRDVLGLLAKEVLNSQIQDKLSNFINKANK